MTDDAPDAARPDPADTPGTANPLEPSAPVVAAPAPPPPPWVGVRPMVAALIPSGVALVVTLLLAVLATVLLSLVAVEHLLESGIGSSGVGTGGITTGAAPAVSGGPLGVIVFVGSLILLGAGSVHLSSVGLDIGGTVAFPPLILTAVVVLVTAWASYAADRFAPARTRVGILVLSAISGLAFALVWTVLAVLSTIGVSSGSSGSGGSGLVLSGASARTLVAALLVVAVSAALGRIVARRVADRGWLAFLPAARAAIRTGPRVLRDLVTLSLVGAAVFGAVTLVGGLIAIGIQSGWGTAVGTVLFWWGGGTAAAAIVGQFGAVWTLTSLATGDTTAVTSGFSSVLSGSPLLWLLPVAALVVALVGGLRMGARRDPAEGARWRDVWVLPVIAAAAWLVLGWTCLVLFGEVSGTSLFGGGSGFVLSTAAPWFFLIAGVWTAAIEVYARLLAPRLVATYPLLARAGGWTGERELPAPLGPSGRRGLLLGGIGAAALVVLVAVGIGAVSILTATVFGPTAVASSYLGRISAGDIAAANRMAAPASGLTPLPAGTLDSPSTRISAVRITSTAQSGSSATVTFHYRLKGADHTSTVSLRDRGDRPLFGDWRVSSSVMGEVQVYAPGVSAVRVNGVTVALRSGQADVAAYPGVYRVALPASRWFTATPASVPVEAHGVGSAELERHPSAALTAEVTTQMKKLIDDCAATGQPDPSGCPFEEYVFGTTSGFAWTVSSYPTVEVGSDGKTFELSGGSVHAEYDETFFGSTDHESDDVDLYGYGTISISGNTVTTKLTTY